MNSPSPPARRILALTKYGKRAASTRQRLIQYLPGLAAHGISFDIEPLLDDAYLARLAAGRRESALAVAKAYAHRFARLVRPGEYDALWVQYEQFPYLPGLVESMALDKRLPLILDYDDAIFHQYDRNRRWLVRRLLGKKLVPLLRRASLCLCGNAYLQDYAQRYCSNSIIVPTVVDTDAYRPAPQPRMGGPVVGWIGSPSTWAYVAPLLPAVLPLLHRYGASLRVIGAGPAAVGIDGVEAMDWAEAREIADVQAMDIGIMPLVDDAWARGKCGYKLIQYMACGLPVVASPVGVNRDIVTEGETGYLASTSSEWVAALERLLADRASGRAMGAAGRDRAVERYSLASQQPRILAALREVLAGDTARQQLGNSTPIS